MQNRRWRLWLGLGLFALVIFGAPTVYFRYDPNPIRYENYDDIRDNMTEAEVEALLGCPPGDYRSGHVDYDLGPIDFPPCETEHRWQGDKGDIVVCRDLEHRITGTLRLRGEREPAVLSWAQALWGFLRGR
jgi:hypothetical protein